MGMKPENRPITPRERVGVAGRLALLGLAALLSHACACAQPPGMGRAPGPTDDIAVFALDVGDEASCTAWKLAGPRDLLVTAAHCCAHPELPLTLQGSKERLYPVAADPVGDVCILSGKAPGEGLELAPEDPPEGSLVWMRGYPFERFVVAQGLWSGVDDDGACYASVYAAPGESGAPILDQHGRVVCVVVAYPSKAPGIAIGCPVARVRALVQQLESPRN